MCRDTHILGYLSQTNENIRSHNNLCTETHSGPRLYRPSSPGGECTGSGTSLRHTERNWRARDADTSHGITLSGEKAGLRVHSLRDSIHVKVSQRELVLVENRSVFARGCGLVRGDVVILKGEQEGVYM